MISGSLSRPTPDPIRGLDGSRSSQENRRKDVELAYFLLRVTIGINIFIHGLSRILAGPSRFADALVPTFQHAPFPPAWCISLH